MASDVYTPYKVEAGEADVDLLVDTIKVALVTSAYTFVATHQYFSDITNEVTGSGYTAGGATLSSKAVNQDDPNTRAEFDAADVTWSSSTITARAAILYKDTGSATSSPLIAYIDFLSDKSSTGGDFTIQWNAEGILQFT